MDSPAIDTEKQSVKESNTTEVEPGYEVVEKYLSFLNENWQNFAKLLIETNSGVAKYQGIRGTEHINLEVMQSDYNVVSQSNRFVVYKQKVGEQGEGKTSVLLCSLLPMTSIRLIIKPNGKEIDDLDNDVADSAVESLYEQMRICWRVMPELLRWDTCEYLYAREFKNVTCLLLIIGRPHYDGVSHFKSMEFRLDKLVKRNFSTANFMEIRVNFPPLKTGVVGSMGPGYIKNNCCQRLKGSQ